MDIAEQDLAKLIANTDQLSQITQALLNSDAALENLETIPGEKARKILRWLRNLRATENAMEDWLEEGTVAEQLDKAEALKQLVQIFATQLRNARKTDPALMKSQRVQDALEAAGTLSQAVAEHTLDRLPDNHEKIAKLEAFIDSLPKIYDMRQTQSVSRLLGVLEFGLERVTRQAVGELTPVERLVKLSNSIAENARKLKSLDTLETPAREESIELAREILRRLKNMKFSDKPVKEMIDTGRPDEKAALAGKIDEMVDMYKNLLAEAVQTTPDILNDPRVQEANNAVTSFSHSIKLMAAKEMPNSLAATQQISADVTQMPDQWKDLDKHTVGRLAQSVEGGVEKAVDELMAQQEQQQQAEQAQEAAEASHSHHGKRRRRRKQRSGAGMGSARKASKDISADDYVLKQGRFSQERVSEPRIAAPIPSFIPPGLKAEDLAAVLQLGNNLRNIGNQVKDIPANEKISPDDKTRSQTQRQRERDQQNRQDSIKI